MAGESGPDAALRSRRRALLVPGRDEKVSDLQGILPDDAVVRGIDFDRSFARLEFSAQLGRVSALIEEAERQRALLVARSFGAWLLLNALTDRAERCSASVVLLAPVLGYGGAGGVGLIAPRAARFWRQVDAGLPMSASTIAVLAAADDDQCPLDLQRRLARHWAIERHELPGAGHGIGLGTALEETRALVSRVLGGNA